jgi:hypothetical protein
VKRYEVRVNSNSATHKNRRDTTTIVAKNQIDALLGAIEKFDIVHDDIQKFTVTEMRLVPLNPRDRDNFLAAFIGGMQAVGDGEYSPDHQEDVEAFEDWLDSLGYAVVAEKEN